MPSLSADDVSKTPAAPGSGFGSTTSGESQSTALSPGRQLAPTLLGGGRGLLRQWGRTRPTSGEVAFAVRQRSADQDPLYEQRRQLSDFVAVVEAAATCSREVLAALAVLKEAPRKLMELVKQMNLEGTIGKQKVDFMEVQIKQLAGHLQGAEPHWEELRRAAADASRRAVDVQTACSRFDEAWTVKVHYDQKVADLEKHSDPNSPGERLCRNRGKQAETTKVYTQSMEQAAQDLEELLGQKWAIAAPMLASLCQGYASVVRGTQSVALGLISAADRLRAPNQPEPETQAPTVGFHMSAVRQGVQDAPAHRGAILGELGGRGRFESSLLRSTSRHTTNGCVQPVVSSGAYGLRRGISGTSTGSTGSWLRQQHA